MKDLYADIPEFPKKIGKKKKKPRTIAVDMEGHCTGCEVCVPFCPVDCIELEPNKNYPDRPIPPVQIRFDECIGCQICVRVCNKLTWNAIRMISTAEVEEKFRSLADGVIPQARTDGLLGRLWHLEDVAHVNELIGRART